MPESFSGRRQLSGKSDIGVGVLPDGTQPFASAGPRLKRSDNSFGGKMIYLDYAANTPCDETVLETYLHTERTYTGNPNSAHCAGRAAGERLAEIA